MEDKRSYADRKDYHRAWRIANADRVRQYERDYYARNPDWRRNYMAKRYADRRALIDQIKVDRGCADCGYHEHACALDFDHREPSGKLFTIAEGSHWNLDRLLAEIEKCDVVCANCHRVRTKSQKLGGRPRREVP